MTNKHNMNPLRKRGWYLDDANSYTHEEWEAEYYAKSMDGMRPYLIVTALLLALVPVVVFFKFFV